MYATLVGFTAYAAGATLARAAAVRDVTETESRVLAYIAPCIPDETDTEQTTALASAVYAQLLHELDPSLAGAAQMATAGLAGFTSGKFSAQFGGTRGGMFPVGVAPAARAILFNAGLLYRGVGTC